jgi:hypothetical protein
VPIVEAGMTPYLAGACRPIMGHRKAAATSPYLKGHIINKGSKAIITSGLMGQRSFIERRISF